MTFKLSLEYHHEDWIGDHNFTIENLSTQTMFKGTIYDYNQIQFMSKTGGVVQWLQDFLQFELNEATHIAEQLNNWQHFINNTNNKE